MLRGQEALLVIAPMVASSIHLRFLQPLGDELPHNHHFCGDQHWLQGDSKAYVGKPSSQQNGQTVLRKSPGAVEAEAGHSCGTRIQARHYAER